MTYQILTLLTPLVTAPYISRVLGAEGIGTYSFCSSVVSYFMLFAAMGTASYGTREISYFQENRKERSRIFWETEILSCMSVIVSMVVYGLFLMCLTGTNRIIYLILSLNILAIAADVSWFFGGMEEFGKIVFRNVVIKILNIIFIFVFVKNKGDLWLYILGMSIMTLLSNTSLWICLPRYIDKPKWKELRPTRNLKVVLSMFIPTIAIQIYTVLDKTMIGLFAKTSNENGYYEQAMQVSKMTLTIVTSLGIVMMPRIGHYFASGEGEKIKDFLYKVYRFVWLLGVPLCFGLVMVSTNLVPWFYGAGFEEVSSLLTVLSFLILSIGISNVTGIQYLIPTKRQKVFTLTVLAGAVVNVLLNLILIPRMYALGAAIASVVAETVVTLVQLYIVRKELLFSKIMGCSRNYLFSGCLMALVLSMERRYLEPSILNTFLMIGTGACIYFTVLFVIRDSFLIEHVKAVWNKRILKV